MVKIINLLKGYVKIRARGCSVERFMNLCGNKNLLIWGAEKQGECYEMYISLPAFYELRPIVRKTSTRVVILERYGLPFFLHNSMKRAAFAVGFLLVSVFLYGSSLFLWDIQYEGNIRLTDEVIEDFLKSQGVSIGMYSKKMDIEVLEKEIRKHFKEVTWTSLKLDGVRLTVSLKENDAPIITNSETAEAENGLDMIAEYDGKIISAIVRSGVPKVSVGDNVNAGAVLVEGRVPVLNEDKTVREYMYVEADGDIVLEHIITYEEILPAVYTEKRYTGREKIGFFVRCGNEEFLIKRSTPYLIYDVLTRSYQPKILDKLEIPLYAGTICYREFYYFEKKYTKEQAEEVLGLKLEQFISSLQEKGVQIIEKDVKISFNKDSWIKSGELTVRSPVITKQPNIGENIIDSGE